MLALLPLAAGYGDVTMLNCPAQFNITLFNLTSDPTLSTTGAFVYGAFSTPANQQRVESIVVNGDYAALGDYVSSMMAPYIIFAAIFFCFYLLTAMCCLFYRSCPPCEALRRDLDTNPYSKR